LKQKGSTLLNSYALDVVDENLDMENLDPNNVDTIELSMGMAHEQSLKVQMFVLVSLAVPPPNLKDPIDKPISSDAMNNFKKLIINELVGVVNVIPSNQSCKKSSPRKHINRAAIGKEIFYGQTLY
jgi:hypothetical protein